VTWRGYLIAVGGVLVLATNFSDTNAQLRQYPNHAYKNGQYGYEINVPPGFKICIGSEDSPGSHPVEIPIDMTVSCSEIVTGIDGTDRVVIEAYFDAGELYRNIHERSSELCKNDDQRVSAELSDFGKSLGGLETLLCTMRYVNGTYAQFVIARKDYEGRAVPIDYTISVMYHDIDKERANDLFRAVIARLTLS